MVSLSEGESRKHEIKVAVSFLASTEASQSLTPTLTCSNSVKTSKVSQNPTVEWRLDVRL